MTPRQIFVNRKLLLAQHRGKLKNSPPTEEKKKLSSVIINYGIIKSQNIFYGRVFWFQNL